VIDREFKNPFPDCVDDAPPAAIGPTYGGGATDAAELAGQRDLCIAAVRKWRDVEREARGLTQ